jgi:hypothetical protein
MPPINPIGMPIIAPGMSTAAGEQPLLVRGWAAELGAPGTGIAGIDVYLDGAPEQGGVLLGTATYGLPRPDVAAAFGNPDWANSGFVFTWTPRNLAAGEHTVTVLARATSGLSHMQSVSAAHCLCTPAPFASPTRPEAAATLPSLGQLADTDEDLLIDQNQVDEPAEAPADLDESD